MTADVVYRPYNGTVGDRAAFRALNEAWIGEKFAIEAKDTLTLGDPETHILGKSGRIFMAVSGEEALGCCALLYLRAGVYELAKMTVAASARGRGVGRGIMAYTIAEAKVLGAASLYLETNSTLADAIHLYEAFGFKHLPPDRVTPSPYARANVFMELIF